MALHLLYIFYVQFPLREVRHTGKKTVTGAFFHLALFDDEYDYINLAYNLSRQGVFTLDGHQPTARRTPLYPLVLAPIMACTTNAAGALVVNCFLASLAAVGCYLLGQLYASPRAGWLAMALVGLSPHTFNWFLWLQAEALLACLLLFFLVSFTALLRTRKRRYAACSGTLAGLAALTRPEAVLLVPLYVAYLGCFFRRNLGVGLKIALIFCLTSLSVISLWVGRNLLILQYPGLATLGGFTFAGGHNDKTFTAHWGSWYAFSGYASPDELHRTRELDEVSFDRYLWQRGWRLLRQLTWTQLVYLELHKLHRTFKPSFRYWGKEFGRERLHLMLVGPYVLLYLAFAGILIIMPLKRPRPPSPGYAVLLLPFLVPLIVTLVFWGTIRFRTPYEPLAFTLGAVYLDNFLRKNYNNFSIL